MIKAIIRKEIRENLKVAVPGFIAFCLVVLYVTYEYRFTLRAAAANVNSNMAAGELQPVTSTGFLVLAAVLAGLFGAALGWMQVFSENNRDLWAFLMHRPITRSRIFWGKAIAGLAMYSVALGLPLGGFLVWDVTPGHVAAPFEWGMVAPLLCLALGGAAFYFAGMLTGLRQARWYVSRPLGLGVAALASATAAGVVNSDAPLWILPLVAALIAGILALAAWGSFLWAGGYTGQPRPAKLALTVIMLAGTAVVVSLAMNVASSFSNRSNPVQYSQSYMMGRDGKVYRRVQNLISMDAGGRTYMSTRDIQVFDLNGNLAISEKTGQPWVSTNLSELLAQGNSVQPIFGDRPLPHYYRSSRFIGVSCIQPPDTIWYYWRRTGRLVGYDARNRLPVGSIGPDGFARNLTGNGDRWTESSSLYWLYGPGRLVHTATNAYRVDLEKQTVTKIFTSNENDPIGDIVSIIQGSTDTWMVVATRKSIHVLDPKGNDLVTTPYQPAYPDYGIVTVYNVEPWQPQQKFCVWFVPTRYEPNHPRLPTHLEWLAADGAITNALDLLELPPVPIEPPTMMAKFLGWVSDGSTPLPIVGISFLGEPQRPRPVPWQFLILSVTGTVIAIGGGWWLGRRYQHTRRAQIGWALFHLVFNVVGLLTFVFVQEWPARVKCPECKTLRVVDHEHCDECGAGFPPPEKNGTEIFGPLEAGPVSRG